MKLIYYHFMANQMGKQRKQWETLFSWAPKSLQLATAATKLKDACSLEAMTKLDSILKNIDVSLPTKVCLVETMAFPVVVYGCDSWTIKKAECQRIDDFDLWCWRRLLNPLTARRSNQSILKEISPDYSLEGLMLKLKLQYVGQLMQRSDSWKRSLCWERLKAGGEGVTEDEMVGWHHRLDEHEFE